LKSNDLAVLEQLARADEVLENLRIDKLGPGEREGAPRASCISENGVSYDSQPR
jgi:hypothetical protein